ncbi:MAG: hypothetical protein AAGF71_09265 [Pseudomonadota bacterium]
MKQIILITLFAGFLAGCVSPTNLSGPSGTAMAQIMAASKLAKTCDVVDLVPSPIDVAAAQSGVSSEQLKAYTFYGNSDQLEAAGDQSLAIRGLDIADEASLCNFASSVVGTEDAIGKFLTAG